MRIREIEGVPVVTSTSDYTWAVLDYVRDGNRAAFMTKLMAIGLPADVIRWHLAHPGRCMALCDVG
jgi:hypothetical protein